MQKKIEGWIKRVNSEWYTEYTEEDIRTAPDGRIYLIVYDEDGLMFRDYYPAKVATTAAVEA